MVPDAFRIRLAQSGVLPDLQLCPYEIEAQMALIARPPASGQQASRSRVCPRARTIGSSLVCVTRSTPRAATSVRWPVARAASSLRNSACVQTSGSTLREGLPGWRLRAVVAALSQICSGGSYKMLQSNLKAADANRASTPGIDHQCFGGLRGCSPNRPGSKIARCETVSAIR